MPEETQKPEMKVDEALNAPVKSTENQEAPQLPKQPQNDEFKPSIFDKIMENTINPHDINDTVEVPRSIFKGYLSFMLGTCVASIGGLISKAKPFGKELKAIPNLLTAVSVGLTAIGTFEFVKPFMVHKNKEQK